MPKNNESCTKDSVFLISVITAKFGITKQPDSSTAQPGSSTTQPGVG